MPRRSNKHESAQKPRDRSAGTSGPDKAPEAAQDDPGPSHGDLERDQMAFDEPAPVDGADDPAPVERPAPIAGVDSDEDPDERPAPIADGGTAG